MEVQGKTSYAFKNMVMYVLNLDFKNNALNMSAG